MIAKNCARSALFYLREYFFPAGCGGCGKTLASREEAYYGLCGECRTFFLAALEEEKRCTHCGKPLISESGDCLSCRAETESAAAERTARCEKTFALFPYTGKFKTVLAAYKFEKSLGVGNFLAEVLSARSGGFGFEAAENAVWVPVPPRPGKIKKQGWDQIEYLCRLLEKERAQFHVNRCLKRLPSKTQKELNRADRGENLKGRIRCVKKPPETAIVFDDVVTTGATLAACAAALLHGGSRRVYGVSLFRA